MSLFLIADPFVQIFNNQFHMWYIFGISWKSFAPENSLERIYKVGHATSLDGIHWQREGRQLLPDIFPDESQALPSVIYYDNRYHMYFCYRQSSNFRNNANRAYRLGYAYSDNLQTWTRNDTLAGIDVSPGSWDSDMMCYPHVFTSENKIYLLYNGNEFGRFGFGLAVLENQ